MINQNTKDRVYYVAENSTCIHIKNSLESAHHVQKASILIFQDACGVTKYTQRDLFEYLKTTNKRIVAEG